MTEGIKNRPTHLDAALDKEVTLVLVVRKGVDPRAVEESLTRDGYVVGDSGDFDALQAVRDLEDDLEGLESEE